MNEKLIAVVDTNIWVSTLIFGSWKGTPGRALERAALDCRLAVSTPIEEELFRTLIEKSRTKSTEPVELAKGILRNAVRTEHTGAVRVCRDPEDDKFLECAWRANANFLITGDEDLLAIGRFHSTQILTPAAFLALPL